RLGAVNLARGATEVRFSRDAGQTLVFASQMETGRVYEIDRAGRRTLRRFDTRGRLTKMMELSRDGFTLYTSNWHSNDISEIDLVSGRVRRRFRSGRAPRGLVLSADGRSLYVATFGAGTIEKIDLAASPRGARRRVIYRGGSSMRHIVADHTRGRLYASDLNRHEIVVVDTASDRAHVLAATDRKPNTIALGPRGRVLFVSCRGRNHRESFHRRGPEWGSVLLLDALDGRVLDAIVGGNQPTGLSVSADGRTLAFSDFLDGRLRVYDVPSYKVLRAGRGGRAKSHLRDLAKDAYARRWVLRRW
ncbi:MAG: YncE family protein, partial [Myxococcales bacterium]|nr:YncE family protein [Myxococcales bacterium]